MGALIDEEQDFAPILDTTCHFDVETLSARKDPLKYTMGILGMTKVENGQRSPKMTPVDIYSVLYRKLVGGDERASLFDIWAKVSAKSLLGLVRRVGNEGTLSGRSLKKISDHVVVDAVIEMDWRSIADDLGYSSVLLQ